MEKVLLWFRYDLRMHDNPALFHAAEKGDVLPLFVYDEKEGLGAASKVWLSESLRVLNNSLSGNLIFRKGDPKEILPLLCKEHGIRSVFWNDMYTEYERMRDEQIEAVLNEIDVSVQNYTAALLKDPSEVVKDDETPYKVFTPFYKKGIRGGRTPRDPYDFPQKIQYVQGVVSDEVTIADTRPWASSILTGWKVGEEGAIDRLSAFIESGLAGYKKGRDFPAQCHVSRLSPHLRFGEISPHTIWKRVETLPKTEDTECFLKELSWREFSYNLLYFNPNLRRENLQEKFNAFPWEHNKAHFEAWKKGETGVPLVDAGMKELWQTGYMHNRVRMVCASYLVKNLLIDWREGEKWFWECLLDADPASNGASWQWVAGCGADAAPYFRVFNPVLQQERFDPENEYINCYVKERKSEPIVDLKTSRDRALKAFESLKD